MKKTQIGISAAVLCCLVSTGCAVDPKTGQPSLTETFASKDPCSNNARNIGIAIGAVGGAIVGAKLGGKTGTLIGAGVAATIGGLIGADMDRKRCELSKLAKKYDLDMTIVDVSAPAAGNSTDQGKSQPVGLSVSIKDRDTSGHFVSGSDELQPRARQYFSDIAAEYSYAEQMKKLPANATPEAKNLVQSLKLKRVLIVGHTDDTGSSQLNADLSERRARNVARIFQEAGIPDSQIFFQGAGETLPIADNHTEEGRAQNRRVEIVDLTDESAFRAYLATRRPMVGYYRAEASSIEAKAPVSKAALATAGSSKGTVSKAASMPKTADTPAHAAPKPAGAVTAASAATAAAVAPHDSKPAVSNVVTKRDARVAKGSNAALDFGGAPASEQAGVVDIGNVESNNSSFSIVSSAHADEPFIGACWRDRPRIGHGVKSLKTGKEDYAISDYMPGLYGTSWADTVNNNLIALTGVAVLRDGGLPAAKPTLLVYQDYDPKKRAKATPAMKETPDVNVYRGDKAVLYRVFGANAVRCMDIVIPYGNSTTAPNSHLYYYREQATYMTDFSPKIAK